jgi:hypothetical protein
MKTQRSNQSPARTPRMRAALLGLLALTYALGPGAHRTLWASQDEARRGEVALDGRREVRRTRDPQDRQLLER